MQSAEQEMVRDLAAGPDQVYAAWTRPERFARWFGPRIFATPAERVVLDVRPGGAWQATMLGEDGFEITIGGVYREVAGPYRLVFTAGDPDDPGDGPPSVVTLTLEEHAGGTRMRVHLNAAAGDGRERAEQTREGWLELIDRLAEHVRASASPVS
ncbi:SRPBCC domain-containing protein [Spongiactinospora rosea]|uniref:SRPBCC domain-containing protein n=1 Tax=Spongiactinospora rosea TaxID=2248750 RepID=A0A366LSK5_9ACTN|nr:SRPBCC domain-containing protein [Spongiactinospora rosea]RBQ16523.1 SRPBCC domain-containing protein [Spongiactinospora rosea]